MPAKLPRKLPANSAPIPKTFSTSCGICARTPNSEGRASARPTSVIFGVAPSETFGTCRSTSLRAYSPRKLTMPASTDSISVSMPEVVKFIRQLAHDLRNHLNAAELQSAYLIEIAENNEQREEIKRLRGMIAQVGSSLQELTAALSQPRLTQMPYAARDFV